jgi:hypothetical protein
LLQHVRNQASLIDAEDYTEESTVSLLSALGTAQQLLTSEHAAQDAVDAASFELIAAINALVLKEVTTPLTATLTGSTEGIVNGALEWTVGITGEEVHYTIVDFVIAYDATAVAFDMLEDDDGYLILADDVIESLRPGLQVIGTMAVPEKGLLRIMLATSGAANAITEQGELLRIHAKVHADAQHGATELSLRDFNVSYGAKLREVDTESASITVGVKLANKSDLNGVINGAEVLYASSVVGSLPGQYAQAVKDDFRFAINAAIIVTNNEDATQNQVTEAIAQLTAAVEIFTAAKIKEPSSPTDPVTPVEPVDKAALITAIQQAVDVHAKAIEGSKLGQYEVGSKATLKAVIDRAKDVNTSVSATEDVVEQTVAELQAAVSVFQARFISLVPGQTGISIKDLAIAASYYGINNNHPDWHKIEKADILDSNEIGIHNLAAIARFILDEWVANFQ